MKYKIVGVVAALGYAFGAAAPAASAGGEPFIGEIAIYPYNFCPRGWASADGQLLSIAENTALFSLYGTTYGGDGRTTFGLPDLRGRVPMHHGQGPGLTLRRLGEKPGEENIDLLVPGLPAHTHGIALAEVSIGVSHESGRRGGRDRDEDDDDDHHSGDHASGSSGNAILAVATDGAGTTLAETLPAGANQPVSNVQPSAVVQYCVALQGLYPSRN